MIRYYPSHPMHNCQCQTLASGQIVHCPLHAKAPEMLDALRWYARQFENDHIKGHTGNDCVHCQTRAILKDLEG